MPRRKNRAKRTIEKGGVAFWDTLLEARRELCVMSHSSELKW